MIDCVCRESRMARALELTLRMEAACVDEPRLVFLRRTPLSKPAHDDRCAIAPQFRMSLRYRDLSEGDGDCAHLDLGAEKTIELQPAGCLPFSRGKQSI